MAPDASSRASRMKERIRKGAWTTGHLPVAPALHHYRTRSIGEQQGTKVKTVEPRSSEGCTFAQLSARTAAEGSQLPKLMAQLRVSMPMAAMRSAQEPEARSHGLVQPPDLRGPGGSSLLDSTRR